jgi:hypothetical protein
MAKQKKPAAPDFMAFEVRPVLGLPRLGAFAALWGAAVLTAYRPNHLPFLTPSYWLNCIPPVWDMSASAGGRHLGHLAFLAAFAALSSLLGRGLLRRAFKVEGLNAFETLSYGFGLGLGTLSLATFALGAIHALVPAAVFAMAGGLACLAFWLNRGLPAAAPAERTSVMKGPACAALSVVVFLLLASEGFHALAPEVSFDALVYHLGLPNLYRLNGGLIAAPAVAFSGFPMLMEWAYTFMLFFSDEISAKLIHWACGLGVAAAFLGIGARLKRPLAGWIACVVFLGMSITVYNIAKAAVDMGSAFFVLLTAASLALHLSRRSEAPLALSAVFCGMALGVKYTNWPMLPLIVAVLAALGEPRRNLIRYALIALAVLSPWIVKNLVLYHNPIFPFLQEWISPHAPFSPAWRRMSADSWGRDWPALLSDGRALSKALLHPWFITIEGVTEFDSIGPMFLIGLSGLLWIRPASAESRLWMWTIFGLWMFWWTTSAMPRYFLPGLGLLSVFIGIVVERTAKRWALFGLLALLAGLSLDAASDVSVTAAQSGNMDYLIGGATKEEYLRHTHAVYPAAYFKAAEWLDQNTPATARVLLLNGGRGYYINRRFSTSSPIDEDLLAHWLKRSGTAEDLLGEFRQGGVSYMLLNMAWLWRGDPDPSVTPERQRVLEEFFRKYTRRRFRDVETNAADFRWVVVYEIGAFTDPSPPAVSPLVRWYRAGGASGLGGQGQLTID